MKFHVSSNAMVWHIRLTAAAPSCVLVHVCSCFVVSCDMCHALISSKSLAHSWYMLIHAAVSLEAASYPGQDSLLYICDLSASSQVYESPRHINCVL